MKYCWVYGDEIEGPFDNIKKAEANAACFYKHCVAIYVCDFIIPETVVQINIDDLLRLCEDQNEEIFGAFDPPTLEIISNPVEAQKALDIALGKWAKKYVSAQGRYVLSALVKQETSQLPPAKAGGLKVNND